MYDEPAGQHLIASGDPYGVANKFPRTSRSAWSCTPYYNLDVILLGDIYHLRDSLECALFGEILFVCDAYSNRSVRIVLRQL